MKKRILSLLLCLCMVLSLMPTVAFAETISDYTMDFTSTTSWGTVAGTDLTISDVTGDGWSWDAANKTLTLGGLDFTTSAGH